MALHPPASAPTGAAEKLIFAPSPDTPLAPAAGPRPAGEFVQHERRGGLRRADLDAQDPVAQFHAWFAEARARGGIAHPETCTLSTASLPSGRVTARMVYLKELDRQGFVLYSNFGTSQKARDLFGDGGGGQSTGNPWAALTFWWEALERQVRVEGRAARLPAAESQVYFDTRVRGSRIGAWASRQSAVLAPDPAAAAAPDDDDGRAQLERWVHEAEARFGGAAAGGGGEAETEAEAPPPIPVPDFWGGLRIVPERIEFWQGRQNRLHDRFVYDRVPAEDGAAGWTLKRLSP